MQIAMKDILMQLIPLGITGWSKMVFHFYIPSQNEFDCSLYFETESGEYIDALTLVEKGLLAKADMDNAFWTVIGLLRNQYIELQENQRWSGLTLVCSSDFHASLYFEYSDANYGLTKEWAYKYLKSNK